MESSGLGDELCFIGPIVVDTDLGMAQRVSELVASSALTAVPQGLDVLQLCRISVGVFSVHWTLWDC